jgi:hypothetical protein
LPINSKGNAEQGLAKSAHVADPFIEVFLLSSFDPAEYLNSVLPPLRPTPGLSSAAAQSSGSLAKGDKQPVPLADVSAEAQVVVSQLNAHTSRLTSTLTQLTDDILRSGSRLAYEVELLRGKTLSLAETLSDTLQDDIERFVPASGASGATAEVNGNGNGQDAKADSEVGGQADGTANLMEPPYIAQLRTLTTVRARLESVIKTFGDAMEFTFPPSEVSVSSSFLSVSAPEPGSDAHSTEEKGQKVLQKLRDEISGLLNDSEDPVAGIEKATLRIEELKDLSQVWKGTAEEKGRAKFIDGLARMVEERHSKLLRDMEAAKRDGTARHDSRRGLTSGEVAGQENKAYGAAYGLISQLQKMRSGL